MNRETKGETKKEREREREREAAPSKQPAAASMLPLVLDRITLFIYHVCISYVFI